MISPGMAAVSAYTEAIQELLRTAQDVKPTATIDPALTVSDFGGGIEKISQLGGGNVHESNQKYYAAIETAFRNVFHHLLAATTIENPAFGQIWNLLDIVSILSDSEQCEPGLVFWLVEELLDSQTIEGCKTVFDYLDSRRERLNAMHFKKKQLIILRACNELLRRLSRAEDTVFCGRVFIFLFQSFPLGDRSSVNLRGEYHVENVTVFDKTPVIAKQDDENMVINSADDRVHQSPPTGDVAAPLEGESSTAEVSHQADTGNKSMKTGAKAEDSMSVLDMDALYPIFWTLQKSFSMPTRLFEPNHFQSFRKGLESTISKFKAVHQNLEARGTSKLVDDNKRSIKRKRDGHGDEFSNSFNPRYLTSRDLFELEVSDLTFRRHILVQALILVDFLLSLTPKAKKKLESTTNKSVLYSYTLSEENTTWATRMRSDIAAYLQQGAEGKFYYRMVDTVLSRDKNWVCWKAENCPPIEHAPVSAQEFALAKNGSHKAYTNKRMKVTPMGSLDLRFLVDVDGSNEIDKLKDPQRYSVPTAESFRGAIADDHFDIDMAKTDEEKQQATNARASKLWRTLRIASKDKLSLFDKIDDGNNLSALFEPQEDDNSLKIIDGGTDQSAKNIVPQDTTTAIGEAPVGTSPLQEIAII